MSFESMFAGIRLRLSESTCQTDRDMTSTIMTS